MVVRLMPQGDFLLPELLAALAVDLDAAAGLRQGVVLEDMRQAVEEPGYGQHNRGRAEVVLPFQEELRVLVALGG